MKCPHCNQEHPEEFEFCPKTGKKIETQHNNTSTLIACTNLSCVDFDKKILPLDSKFCPTCGQPINDNNFTEDKVEIKVGEVKFNMIRVEHGEFMMGATIDLQDTKDYERPVHKVILTQDYYISQLHVSQALWEEVMGENPSVNMKGCRDYPVEHISWFDCLSFIHKLNERTNLTFRLPTEAEWEFAARGGNKSNHYQYSGSNELDEVAWDYGNSGNRSHSVKTKKQNELGIYDMSGNVLEWCHDWYGCYTNNEQINPTGPFDGEHRVCRGGHWHDSTWYCRLSTRSRHKPDTSGSDIGFRLALSE